LRNITQGIHKFENKNLLNTRAHHRKLLNPTRVAGAQIMKDFMAEHHWTATREVLKRSIKRWQNERNSRLHVDKVT
jgi:hypothetical protein